VNVAGSPTAYLVGRVSVGPGRTCRSIAKVLTGGELGWSTGGSEMSTGTIAQEFKGWEAIIVRTMPSDDCHEWPHMP
jgi:hypothetical protein